MPKIIVTVVALLLLSACMATPESSFPGADRVHPAQGHGGADGHGK